MGQCSMTVGYAFNSHILSHLEVHVFNANYIDKFSDLYIYSSTTRLQIFEVILALRYRKTVLNDNVTHQTML